MDLKPWLKTVIPLTAGMAAAQVMFSVDAVFIRKFFSADDSGLYGAAGTIARGLVTFTGPMAAVMFPKLVRSAARGEKTNVLQQTLLATGVLAIGAAVFCTLFPILLFQLLNKKEYFVIAPLVPWFAWCLAPLTLTNVLVNNLLARSRFAAIPWLVLIAAVYWFSLERIVQSHAAEPPLQAFRSIVQAIGCFNLFFLGVSWFFNWRAGRTPAPHQ
jgi:O-antigen/teichoic acid export membrane protein